jgi:molecular chaperone DnaK
VTFDIDANGIVHVSAKDLGTGKEQSIRITASSGLNESEIKKMVKDAEEHAAEDAAKREEVTLRNQADTLVYATEKALKDVGDKIDAADRAAVEDAVAELKKALEKNDNDAIKAGIEKLNNASHKLSEQLYKQHGQSAGPGPQAGPDGGASSGGPSAGSSPGSGPEVVEGEIVDEK